MRLVQRLAFILALALPAASSQAANTTARLVLSHEAAKPGETVWAGMHLRMNQGWHTYWQNGGDAGAGTKIDWTLPAGVTVGAVQWPLPEKKVDVAAGTSLTSYVYHNDVVLDRKSVV